MFLVAAWITSLTWPVLQAAAAPVAIRTYHADNFRTGWNAQETILTPRKVAGGKFGLVATVTVDEQVNAQPLIVPRVNLPGQGRHDVAYVATANNTMYAIDAATGAILLSRNFGAPVPAAAIPGGCTMNSGVVGIDSTPVIDAASGRLYAITYTEENSAPVYRLHALAIDTLEDALPPQIISASADRANGTPYDFNPAVNQQRPALLLSGGNIYAGFGSFCDHNRHTSRGWLLGWHADTLAPLASSLLLNRQVKVPNNYFLTSIWMSGNGPAADAAGNVYVVTGNSDTSGTTYDSSLNPAHSVLKLPADLSAIADFFTPGGSQFGEPILDIHDLDFGAGGVMLLPPQSGSVPNLAVAAGKVGQMYLLDQAHLGGYVPDGPDNVLGAVAIGRCWCGESYFTGADGIGRVVSSGDINMRVWRVQTSPVPSLVQESISAPLPSGNEGFFTAVSSNGTEANTAIIWAVARPNRTGPAVLTLLAYDANNASTLFSALAGSWSSNKANANVVPVVANGRVYVGSYKSVAIFGMKR